VAIVLAEPDGILALGALVASKLYGTMTPVVVVDDATYRSIASGMEIEIRRQDGGWEVRVRR
jgi:hypothetical protein